MTQLEAYKLSQKEEFNVPYKIAELNKTLMITLFFSPV